MVSCLSNLFSNKAKNIIGAATVALAGVTYLGNGIIASTAIKVATAYATYCPNHGEPVTTPLGAFTCLELKKIVTTQDTLMPLLSWTTPIVVTAATVFIFYKLAQREDLGCCYTRNVYTSLVESPRRQVDTQQTQRPQKKISYVTTGDETDFYTCRDVNTEDWEDMIRETADVVK